VHSLSVTIFTILNDWTSRLLGTENLFLRFPTRLHIEPVGGTEM